MLPFCISLTIVKMKRHRGEIGGELNIILEILIMCQVFSVCSVAQLCPTLQPHSLKPARLFCPWDFPGKNIRVGCCFLLQGIFPTQGSNLHLLCLLHCRQILYSLSHHGSLKNTGDLSQSSISLNSKIIDVLS